MAKIQWDKQGEKTYHSGLDRGVLYPKGSPGVPWNGLTGVTESSEGKAITPLHQDGIKYVNEQPNEEYKAKIQALTFPDEFYDIIGRVTSGSGLYFNQQYRKEFGFSYRTFVGSDTEGPSDEYRLHLVYNAIVLPEQYDRSTWDDSPSANEMSWDIITVPSIISGQKPTSTFTISSEETSPEKMAAVEDILYGTSSKNPRMPTVDELVTLFDDWPFLQINMNVTTGIHLLTVRGLHDLKGDLYKGAYSIPPDSRLVGSPLLGVYKLGAA